MSQTTTPSNGGGARVLLDPTGERHAAVRERAPRLDTLAGKTVGLLDRRKPRGDGFLDAAERCAHWAAAELEGLHGHLEALLTQSGFLRPDHPRQLRLKLRRLFMRADLDRNEVNILRGALTSLDPGGSTPPTDADD